MANLLKGLKVNGTSYGIDYDSLANRPFYKDITMGDYLLEETQLTLAAQVIEAVDGGTVSPFASADIDIQTEVEAGDTFILLLDGEEYKCSAETDEGPDGASIYMVGVAGGLFPIFAQWSKTSDGTWQTGSMNVPSKMEGTYTISIQKYTKETKIIDRELLGLYEISSGRYTKLDKGLAVTDFVGGILRLPSLGQMYILITQASDLNNGFIGFAIGTMLGVYTYNPVSGYLIEGESGGYTYDVTEELSTSTTYSESKFVGSALVSGSGDPVMIYEAEQSDTVWSLYAAEQYLYDADGNVVHNFGFGAITFDSSTGVFTFNNGENPNAGSVSV